MRHAETMSVLEDALAGHTVVVAFPAGGVSDWVAVGEVLADEGLTAWAWPADRLDQLPDVVSMFGRRVRIGVAGALDPDGREAAARHGAAFWLSPLAVSPDEGAPLPYLAGALTPNEVAAVAAGREGAPVLVVPADALGTSFARTLPVLVPGVPVVPWGRLERYQCEMWLEAGAVAVVVQDVIVRPEISADVNPLEEVARRAASFGNWRQPETERAVGVGP